MKKVFLLATLLMGSSTMASNAVEYSRCHRSKSHVQKTVLYAWAVVSDESYCATGLGQPLGWNLGNEGFNNVLNGLIRDESGCERTKKVNFLKLPGDTSLFKIVQMVENKVADLKLRSCAKN